VRHVGLPGLLTLAGARIGLAACCGDTFRDDAGVAMRIYRARLSSRVLVGGSARQAGGHWFEPSTAHLIDKRFVKHRGPPQRPSLLPGSDLVRCAFRERRRTPDQLRGDVVALTSLELVQVLVERHAGPSVTGEAGDLAQISAGTD
jgi:hypothetical protein